MKSIRKQIMQLDYSWNKSAGEYLSVYESMVPYITPEVVKAAAVTELHQEKTK
jgi:glycogen synthase